MAEVTRPVLRYHGGKWRLAPWIISHFPAHRVYVEPYGGAASVLLRKPRVYSEVYNDLDGEIVNLFRVLRNPSQARELQRLVRLTPFAREEFNESYITADDPIERARRLLFRSFAGFGTGLNARYGTGFRNNVTRAGTTPAKEWTGVPKVLEQVAERLSGVVIESEPALRCIDRFGGNGEALLYCDPPYVHATRNDRHIGDVYRFEMTDDEHRELAATLRQVRGMVIVSGYACDLYDQELYPDWRRVTMATHGDGARDRTEVLWLSPNVATQRGLFD